MFWLPAILGSQLEMLSLSLIKAQLSRAAVDTPFLPAPERLISIEPSSSLNLINKFPNATARTLLTYVV